MELTEYIAQRVLMRNYVDSAFVLPNFTPRIWWECDVFAITKAGYFREFEIKLTLGDFKADRKKNRRRVKQHDGIWHSVSENKHQLLAQGYTNGPCQFWYVTPPGLLFTEAGPDRNPEAMLPPWAGLIEISPGKQLWHMHERVSAPRLHQTKISANVAAHAKETCYWRMHRLLKTWNSVEVEGAT